MNAKIALSREKESYAYGRFPGSLIIEIHATASSLKEKERKHPKLAKFAANLEPESGHN